MPLDTTLDGEVTDGAVAFTLRVRNTGDDPVTFQFRSGQRMDVVVERAGTDEAVWRWSEGRMFTQVLGSRTLDPGEEATYEATWEEPESGEFRVRGWLTAAKGADGGGDGDGEGEIEAETTVSVP